MLHEKSVLTAVEQYSMGEQRKLKDYLEIAGLNMTKKEVLTNEWCSNGRPPKGFETFDRTYTCNKFMEPISIISLHFKNYTSKPLQCN